MLDGAGNIFYNGTNVIVTGMVHRTPFYHGIESIEYDGSGSIVRVSGATAYNLDSITKINDISIAPNGDIYVAGYLDNPSTGRNAKVIKLDSLLTVRWQFNSSFTGNDEANSVAIDNNGAFYVGGYRTATTEKDFLFAKLDTAGSLIWGPLTYNGPINGDDELEAISLDNNDNPIITGSSELDSLNLDYYTMRYDTAGTMVWAINYNGLANKNDVPTDISIDPFNNIFVIGQSQDTSGANSQYVTVKYVEHELWNVPDDDTIPSNFDLIPNWGQLLNADTVTNVNTTTKYYSKGGDVFFEDTRLIHLFKKPNIRLTALDSIAPPSDTLVRVDMVLTSDTTRRVFAQNKRDWYSNFYYPHTAATNGLVNIPSYESIIYPEIYKNIDLRVSANVSGMKEQFILKQGSDPKDIAFFYVGADSVYIDNSDLVIVTLLDTIRYKRPKASQIDSSGNYVNLGWDPHFSMSNDTVFFDSILTFNSNLPLVVEMNQGNGSLIVNPGDGICWSTYVGGAETIPYDSEIDMDGYLLSAGTTTAIFVPATPGVAIGNYQGGVDGVIMKLWPDHHLYFTTYYGGNSNDYIRNISTDASGNIYAVGNTNSSILLGSLNSFSGATYGNGFIVKINPSGTMVNWSRYIGGDFYSEFYSVDVNNINPSEIIIAGNTLSSNFPIIASVSGSYSQASHATNTYYTDESVLVKINSSGTILRSTCYGGTDAGEEGFFDVEFDSNGDIFVVGRNQSWNFPRPVSQPAGAFVDDTWDGQDIVICKFSNNTNLIWATLYGGESYYNEEPGGLTISSSGDLYVFGTTVSSDFNTVPFGGSAYYDDTYGGGNFYDGVIIKFNSNLGLDWATFYGGSHKEEIYDILEVNDYIFVTGYTISSDFQLPVSNPPGTFYSPYNASDPFILAFNNNLELHWGTFIPGYGGDYGVDLSTDGINLYLLSHIGSISGFPLDPGNGVPYYQPTKLGAWSWGLTCFDLFPITINVEELSENYDVKIFPNPANIDIRIESSYFFNGLELMDVSGKIVFNSNFSSSQNSIINVSSINSGIYIMRLFFDNKIACFKIVINH
jgi:hypothetical protein